MEAGYRLGKFQIVGKLGAGGMADVYLAEDTTLQRKVALKLLPPSLARNTDLALRFEKEVLHCASLQHPGIVTIYEVGHQGEYHFYTMSLLNGGDLKQKIKAGLSPQQSLQWLRQIAEALGHAHLKGFVHRDLKPENILFDDHGKPIITDFGIAKAVGSGTGLTGTGMSIGTPHYMSPEQAQGLTDLDGRSDLYALGVVLYEMLTGSVPFDADNTIGVAMQHVQAAVPGLPSHLGKLQPLLERLLAKNPQDRYSNAAELTSAIDQLLSGADLPQAERPKAAAKTRVMPVPAAQKQGSGLKWALGGALLAVIVGGGLFLLTRQDPPRVIAGGAANIPPQAVARQVVTKVEVPPPPKPSPDPAAIKSQQITQLLLAAEQDLQNLRLMNPAGNNALEKFRQAQSLDPANAEARKGVRRVAEKYLELARQKVTAGQFAKAQGYLQKAEQVYPTVYGLYTLKTELETARENAAIKPESAIKHEVAIKQEAFTDPSSGMQFVLVKGGCFQMGQTAAEKRYLIQETGEEKYKKYFERELPRHEVCVDDLYVGRLEVTVGQFRQFVNDTGYRTDAEKNTGNVEGCRVLDVDSGKWDWRAGTAWNSPGFSQQNNQPVVCVSWNDSRRYIDWLTKQSGKKYRFATEAEWEYAARGGTETIRFWGDDPDQACKYANVADQTKWPDGSVFSVKSECNDGYFYPAPVGRYRPNPFGLYDMLGNVWEWTNDRFDSSYYSQSPRSNPQGPLTAGSNRVIRGGGWSSNPTLVRAALRGWGGAANRNDDLGFRLVSSAE